MGKSRLGNRAGSGIKFNNKGSGIGLLRKPQKLVRTPSRKKISKELPVQNQEWDLKVNQRDWFQGKVNAKPSDLISDILNGRFTEEQKRMFRTTCFDHYLDISEIAVNPQLIHQILLREVNQPNEEEIWFRIGSENVKFGIDDFLLITGLRCSGDNSRKNYASKYCRLRCQYFNNLPHITIQDVFKVFTSMSNLNNRDVVIMRILFLLTNLMYSTTYKRFFDETLLVLVDSPDMKVYPWGNDIFKFTFTSLKLALRNKQVTVEGEGRPSMSYRLNDFIAAFQVWIYEVLPILESKICWKVASRRLRILNWTYEVDGNVSPLNLGVDIFSMPDVKPIKMVSQVAEALDPLYLAMKHKSHPSKPTKPVSNPVFQIIDNDDDDFVIPTHHPPRNAPITSCSKIGVTKNTNKTAATPLFTDIRSKPVPRFDQPQLNGLRENIPDIKFGAKGIIIDQPRTEQSHVELKSMKGKEILIADDSSDEECVYVVDDNNINDVLFQYPGE